MIEKNILIAPSMLSSDFSDLRGALAKVKLGGADWVHLDVMDGTFVQNLTFGMPIIKSMRPHSCLPFDAHLMIVHPEKYAAKFVQAGADYVTFHPNATEHPADCLKIIKAEGAKCGIALNPDIPFEPYKNLAKDCDLIVVMCVYAGFGGQKLIPECLDKVREIKAYLAEVNPNCLVEVDGGVTEENASTVVAAGADVLVAGTAFFKSSDPEHTVQILKGTR